MRATPLLAEHERLGATLTGFAGWRMPLRYGSETAEHRAVRQAAGLFDLSHMGEIMVTGPAAAAALDYWEAELDKVKTRFHQMTGATLSPLWRAPGGYVTPNTRKWG